MKWTIILPALILFTKSEIDVRSDIAIVYGVSERGHVSHLKTV